MNTETVYIKVPVRITYHTPAGRERVLAIAENRIELFVTNYEQGETVTGQVIRGAHVVDRDEAAACAVIQDGRRGES